MPPRFDARRFYLAAFLALAMAASLIWFNVQTSRRYAVAAVREALGPDAPAFVIDGEKDFMRSDGLMRYNNLWCGTVTSGPPRRFAVLVRQPGRSRLSGEGRRRGSAVMDLAISPSSDQHTGNQAAMLDACAALKR